MRYKLRMIAFSTVLVLTFLLGGCVTFEKKGIPVKEFEASQETISPEVKAKKAAEIKKLSEVDRNNVFTEASGMPEYIVGPGDVLQITFWDGSKPLAYTTEVRADGKISYSFVDDLYVNGLTVQQVDDALTRAMQKYIRNPRLEIIVKEHRSKTAFLSGQINRFDTGISGMRSGPGRYPLTGKMTVLDLIVGAGGPIAGQVEGNADLTAVELVRKGKIYTLNLYNSMFRGDMSENMILEDRDMVTVPELPIFGERVYVLGEVTVQGIYRLKDAYDLLAALSKAGGPTRIAVKTDVKVIRELQERKGNPIIISANYDEMTKRGDISQNIRLKNGDVVWVPRTVIGDINEFILNTVPLLEYMLYPADYRDAYGQPNQMRIK
jgi:protein involved in polysaccharide export with SLBB domain